MIAGTQTVLTPLQYAAPCSREASILVIDSRPGAVQGIRTLLEQLPYRVHSVTEPTSAWAVINAEPIDLIIVHQPLGSTSGIALSHSLRSDFRTCFIPLLITVPAGGESKDLAGMSAGADNFLTEPLHGGILRSRVETLIQRKQAVDILEQAETVLTALAQAVEQRDPYTGDHCRRMACYSVALGRAVGLPEHDLLTIHRGAILHDIGKIGVPDAVLSKPGPLSPSEWSAMQRHVIIGEEICRAVRTFAPVLPIIRSHHERWDGGGYPDRLAGEEIPLLARIVQMADIYDALTTSRPYKPAYSREKALQIMREETRTGWRDPYLMALFDSLDEGQLEASPSSLRITSQSESLWRLQERLAHRA